MPFTLSDVMLMLGLALAGTLFIFLLVNPPEFVVIWLTGKKRQKRRAGEASAHGSRGPTRGK